ncbi:hypothetical protein [Candidatus Nitrospira bockiana]
MHDLPPHAEPTLIACPSCAGVLMLVAEGDGPHVHFLCTTGHAFALQFLLEAKEEELERSLWSAASQLQHVDMVLDTLIRQVDQGLLPLGKESLRARQQQVRDQIEQIQRLIEDTGSPGLEEERPS